MGGQSGCEFLLVKSRSEWVTDFKDWLDESSEHDVIGQEEPEPSHPPEEDDVTGLEEVEPYH